MKNKWPRIIAHVDMDAFFASIEQRDFPELRGKPVAITNGLRGSCIITCSYEARRYGVKTGMRIVAGRKLCPELIQRPSRPEVYAAVSTKIMQELLTLTPDMEIFSVDEAFLEFTYCQNLYFTAGEVIKKIKKAVGRVSQLTCSVGLSGDKTTAKYASKRNKPNGFFIVPPWRSAEVIAPLPVTALCGIAKGVAGYLAQHGVYYCGDMRKIPISVLARRFGSIGRRIWYMAQGKDPAGLIVDIADPKSIGHGKVVPPNTKDEATLLFFLSHMSEKVARRLRAHRLQAKKFQVGIKLSSGWCTNKFQAVAPTHSGQHIYSMAKRLLVEYWTGEGVFQCQVTALDPQPENLQKDLFIAYDDKIDQLNKVMDAINDKFGLRTLTNGVSMRPLEMPEVISPAWRPSGHRSTIKKSVDY